MMPHSLLQTSQQDFSKVLLHLQEEYAKLQVGRASAGMVDHLVVEAYGVMQPLKSIANISIPDARTVQIQPWDRSMLSAIEKAIQTSDLNLNPVNNGLAILLNIPPLTEERRRDLTKVVSKMAEESKIAVRNLRHELLAQFKRLEHEKQMSEDEVTGAEKKVQEMVDTLNTQIEDLAQKKEGTLMTL